MEAIRGEKSWRRLGVPSETVKLTASFKLNASIPENLFSMYGEVLNHLLNYASGKGLTSFKRRRNTIR
jgi:hypothetical protein